jgi:hypothetical protein
MCSQSLIHPLHQVSLCQDTWEDEQLRPQFPVHTDVLGTGNSVNVIPSSLSMSCTNCQNLNLTRTALLNNVAKEPSLPQPSSFPYDDNNTSHNALLQTQFSFPDAETNNLYDPFPLPSFMSLSAFGVDDIPRSIDDSQYTTAYVPSSIPEDHHGIQDIQGVLAADSDPLMGRVDTDFLFEADEEPMLLRDFEWSGELKQDFRLDDPFETTIQDPMVPQVSSLPYFPPLPAPYATSSDADDPFLDDPFRGAMNLTLPSSDQDPLSPLDDATQPFRDAQDIFLIQAKNAGLSYKEIKAQGKFKQAESTLRGRFRTLTKAKDRRVRKPKWQEKDVS